MINTRNAALTDFTAAFTFLGIVQHTASFFTDIAFHSVTGVCCPVFGDRVMAPPSGPSGPVKERMIQLIFFIGPSSLENETIARSRNVAQRTASHGAQYSGITGLQSAPLKRPEYLFYIVSYCRKVRKS